MCLYQNIHTAYHYELLNFDAGEREKHVCKREIIPPEEGRGEDKCPLHSCCVLSREVIFRCQEAPRDGEGLCEKALGEDVFVPPVAKGESERRKIGDADFQDKPSSENREHEERVIQDQDYGAVDQGVSPAMMEFWPEDQPGIKLVVHLEDEVPEGEGDLNIPVSKPAGRLRGWLRRLK
ncbi:hypothetical protein F4677DRAFT_463735 [Hypoxylon crocopeplum]|nr:hypothetical protein F4677DRAFT_463735 [Hypoxylon crocopeplum]